MYARPMLLIEGPHARPPTASEALNELGLTGNVVHCHDLGQALERLKGERALEPAVIVLDGLIEAHEGLDVLRAFKSSETLRSVPVVVLAPSGNARVVDESFSLGVAGFVVKSGSRSEFVEAVRAIHEYWTLSEAPPCT